MTPLQMRVLLAVDDAGSFTAAADALGLSQPSVSRTVALVERQLGSQLFRRQQGGVVVTEAGRICVERLRGALGQLDLMREELALLNGDVVGTLRIASLPSATRSLLGGPLRRLADLHPAVRVVLFEGTDHEVREWLSTGAADVGVVTLPAPGLDTVDLGHDEMVAVLPPGHDLARATSVTWTQLARERFILPTGGCGPLIVAAARRADVELDVAHEAREPRSLIEMVRAGLGVTVLPTLNLPAAAARGGVIARPLSPRLPRALGLAVAQAAGAPARAFCSLSMSSAATSDR